MLSPIDHALWRLFRNDHFSSGYDLTTRCAPILLALSLLLWVIAERRWRTAWCSTKISKTKTSDRRPAHHDDGGGPYRASSLPTFLDRAPLPIRLTSLFGIFVGLTGLGWLVPFVADIQLLSSQVICALLLEAIGFLAGLLSLISALAMLRKRQPFGKREALLLRIAAVLLGGLSSLYLLHAFDRIPVTAFGIKWHETMTLERFLSSGFSGIVFGHFGLTWRLLLRAIAGFGVMSAGYFLLWAKIITSSLPNTDVVAQEQEGEVQEGDGSEKIASPSSAS